MRKAQNQRHRFLTIALLLLFMPIFVFGTTVAATGTIMVSVDEHHPDGAHLFLPVPAILVDLAVLAAPAIIPEDALAEARQEVGPQLPALKAFAAALADCPDGVLVEVQSPEEQVRIAKEGRSFAIDVKSSDADVSVRVPARILSRALSLL